MINPTRRNRASAIGAAIAVLAVLALVVFGGVWLNQARDRLMGQIDGLESELSTAHARIGDLERQVIAEGSAREEAEASAKAAGDRAAQARQELQNRQETLGGRIQELEASVRDYEQRLAAAVEAKTKVESGLSRETELRASLEQDIAGIRAQFHQQGVLAGRQRGGPSGMRTEARAGAGAPGAAPVGAATESGANSTRAAKQRFDEDASADASEAFDTPPKPLALVSPEYPRALKQQGTGGQVLVAFTVDTEGRVHDVEVRDASDSEFGDAAVAAVRKWRFSPALRDGEPVQVRIAQQLTFNTN